ncbi:unnamed protein product [Prorocentrum cordatum]|uniref:Uncharacterized protein n=1 Tax=Prorocentrum cordatum TaxID=2364126 RepID=A0ABN9Q530_9DINO|nr:unnamed protein product [Polarella glacialis]
MAFVAAVMRWFLARCGTALSLLRVMRLVLCIVVAVLAVRLRLLRPLITSLGHVPCLDLVVARSLDWLPCELEFCLAMVIFAAVVSDVVMGLLSAPFLGLAGACSRARLLMGLALMLVVFVAEALLWIPVRFGTALEQTINPHPHSSTSPPWKGLGRRLRTRSSGS